jgi:DNA-3-methyladenine glycosylase II
MAKKKADINTDSEFVPASLTEETFGQGLHFLSGRDPDLAQILTKLGPPPMWARAPGFPTLILIILEQQVSLASARAAYDRLREAASPLTPVRFLELDDTTLKAIGFSRQKTAYGRGLAKALVDGHLDLVKLAMMPDTKVRTELIKVKGIGPWTADIYLLMALRRPDIMPSADLALLTAVQKVKRLAARPTPDELNTLSKNWKPWRSVAARLLWHYYLLPDN